MGTWGEGPFDNDTAADWCGELDDADPAARGELIRTALTAVASTQGYLDCSGVEAAIAAAAIVASRLPGGPPMTSNYAPEFLLAGQSLDLDDDMRELAVRALHRILGDDSEWRELWNDAGVLEFPEIDRLHAVLAPPAQIPGQMTLL